MKILITGGAGYIGTELTFRLAQRNDIDEIIIYDNLSRHNYNFFLSERFSASTKIRFVEGELLDTRNLKKALDGVDVLYHLAGKVTTPFAAEDHHIFDQVNNWGTAELSYLIEESNIKKVVFASSMSVYGSSLEEITEQTAPNPRTHYGISKYRGEKMLKRLESEKEIFTLRIGNVYGYNKSMRFDAVINKFVFDAHFKNRVTINGSGQQKRAFISIHKVAQALEKIIFTPEIPSGTYNLAEHCIRINDVIEGIKILYPKMESINVQQDLKMRSLRVSLDSALTPFELFAPSSLQGELKEFKEKFTFNPSF